MHVSDDPRVGTLLANYRIVSLLGWGGMSVVYLAEDLRLKRRVALKLLAAGLAEDETFREHFLRESELAASIDHPGIVPIYEAGTADGLLFISMRYVEGGDLKQRLNRARLDPGDAVAILAQLASALDAAHARGLVHRDVKPSNVLVDRGARPDGSDHVYLTDFGLTKPASQHPGPGDDGHLLGTVDYVAPEQIAGGEIDGRADVYSLGCLLYECLVGQPPFRGESDLAVVFAHLEADPPTASATRVDLPAALDGVITRALAKSPAERYASCREFARAALGVMVDETSHRLADVATRAAIGRSRLNAVEAELTSKLMDLAEVREQARALSNPATPTSAAASQATCPFKGLASFELTDAQYFFGRERLVAELVARVVGTGLVGIVGPSGSGKSSVLRAGLLPALAGGVLPGSDRWQRLLLRPGEWPLDELRRVLASAAQDPLVEALNALPTGARLVIAVDQAEEVFTACRSDDQRDAFIDALARAAADPQRRALVLVAVRADFYGRFAAHPRFAGLLGANHILVGPMQASELRRAVEMPADRVGIHVEAALADALVDDVEGEPGGLPLLSTALLELWLKRQANTLTLTSYLDSGGVHGAVARLAESTYADIPDAAKPLVRAIMLRLVEAGEGNQPVRRRAPLSELELQRDRGMAEVLSNLADNRLVTISEGSVEVAHEALLSEWPRLREWIEEDGASRLLRRHITRTAVEWDTAGRDPAELYRGARLAAALDWSTDHAVELNTLERAFVTESRDAAEKDARRVHRTNRWLRALLTGVVVLLVAALAGGGNAVVQRGEARAAAAAARDAETAQLAQRLGAQALVEEGLDLSVLLARQAVAIDESPQTRGSLLAVLRRFPTAMRIMHKPNGSPGFFKAIDISPDGGTLALADAGGAVFAFDARTYEPVGTWSDGPANTLAFSPTGKALAAGITLAERSFVRLYDALTNEQLVDLEIGNVPTRMAFTNDGTRLVVVEAVEPDGAWITIRDAQTLELIGTPLQPEGFQTQFISQWDMSDSIALTPDNRSLITTSQVGELTWWDLQTREKTRTLPIGEGYSALAISPDGRTLAVGLNDGIQLIDVGTSAARQARGGLTYGPISLMFSPDGRTVVSTGRNGTVTLWDVGTATAKATLYGHSDSVWQSAFSPDGKTLYTASLDGTVIAWDAGRDGRSGRTFTFTDDRGRYGWPDTHPAKFSPDGNLIAVGLNNEGLQLWDARSLVPVGPPLQPTDSEVTSLTFSPDGRILAAGTDTGRATLWDVESRSLLHGPFVVDPDGSVSVSFSMDGTTLATAGASGVGLWDATDGTPLGQVGNGLAKSGVAFSPTDPRVIAFIYDGWGEDRGGDAEIWDVGGPRRIKTLDVAALDVLGWTIAFSPDGNTLATGGVDPFVHLWDVRTGKLIREFRQNVGTAVWSLDFSPDGRVLAMSGGDGYASLMDVDTGAQIGPRIGLGGGETMLDLSPDGRRLLMTDGDGTAAIHEIAPEDVANQACRLANRTLTREEWAVYLPGRPYQPACT